MNSQKDELLLNILASKLFAGASPHVTSESLEKVLLEAEQQGVLSIVLSGIRVQMADDVIRKEYEARNDRYLKHNLMNLHYHKKISETLRRAEIPHAIIKGQASARYYPDPMLRCSGDVDFLVDEADKEKVDAILESQGYARRPRAIHHDFHWGYEREGISVEMHWKSPGIPVVGGDEIEKTFFNIFTNAENVSIGGIILPVPSSFHHGMIMLLHVASHLTSGGIGLRHLCDWLVFENEMEEEAFTSMFEQPLKDAGLWEFAKILTQIGVLYMGCKKRSWCKNVDSKLCRELLEDILRGGDFGRKDELRKSQSKLYRNNDMGTVNRTKMSANLMANYCEKVRRTNKEHHVPALLTPITWIIVAFEYIGRVIKGKRNNILNLKLLKGAQKRQNVYARLKLFEKQQ